MLHFEDNLMCDYHSFYVIYTTTLAINGWKGFAYSFGLVQTRIVLFIYLVFIFLSIYLFFFFESVKFFYFTSFYEGESIKNQPNLFLGEIDLFFFDEIAL